MNTSNEKNSSRSSNTCLVCGDVATKRGLCLKHYEQFRRKRDSLTAEAAAQWEEILIASERLLPKQQGKKFGIEDPFLESFDAFVAENPTACKKTSPTVKELVAIAKKKSEEHDKKR